MTYIGTTDYFSEIQQSKITGRAMVHKFGRNDDVANGSFEMVTLLGNTAANHFRSSATQVRVKAGNTNDTSGGSGAQTITVQGINDSLNEVAESVTLAGTSASSNTTQSFWRVHRAWVTATGSYGGSNTGDIVIEDSGGTHDYLKIAAGEGQTQDTVWTVPTGKTAYLLSLQITVDGSKAADVHLYSRENFNDAVDPMKPVRLRYHADGVIGSMSYVPRGPHTSFPALTDIWIEASGSGANTEVGASFELLVVDD